MELRLGFLYPSLMSLYGDQGNAMVLKKRAEWQGLTVQLQPIEPGDEIPVGSLDLLIAGGGQDRQQELIGPDLRRRGADLRAAVLDGLPVLAICGAYQLFGHYYQTAAGDRIEGLGILDLITAAGPSRLVGNISLHVTGLRLIPPTLAGFENHAGRTQLGSATPLGRILHGHGNNGLDGTEGAVHLNCLGTYLHGPILAVNPHLADYLLDRAVERRYGRHLTSALDRLEVETHRAAVMRR